MSASINKVFALNFANVKTVLIKKHKIIRKEKKLSNNIWRKILQYSFNLIIHQKLIVPILIRAAIVKEQIAKKNIVNALIRDFNALIFASAVDVKIIINNNNNSNRIN